ncbi:hypothetical protein U1Q18_013319 [Sarracenia purpurea var. burkii]
MPQVGARETAQEGHDTTGQEGHDAVAREIEVPTARLRPLPRHLRRENPLVQFVRVVYLKAMLLSILLPEIPDILNENKY